MKQIKIRKYFKGLSIIIPIFMLLSLIIWAPLFISSLTNAQFVDINDEKIIIEIDEGYSLENPKGSGYTYILSAKDNSREYELNLDDNLWINRSMENKTTNYKLLMNGRNKGNSYELYKATENPAVFVGIRLIVKSDYQNHKDALEDELRNKGKDIISYVFKGKINKSDIGFKLTSLPNEKKEQVKEDFSHVHISSLLNSNMFEHAIELQINLLILLGFIIGLYTILLLWSR